METGTYQVELVRPWGPLPEKSKGAAVPATETMSLVQFTDIWGKPIVMRVPNDVLTSVDGTGTYGN